MLSLRSVTMLSKIYDEIWDGFKNIYGRFWATTQGFSEYFLKIDGYYFSKKQNCTIVVLQVRNKRTIEKVPIKKMISDKKLVKELHPADACFIGILANNEINKLVDVNCDGWQKMKKLREHNCFIRSGSILKVHKRYFDKEGKYITVLRSPSLAQEIEIPTVELSKNEALLYALDHFEAISVGYDASESYLRQHS